MVVRRRVHLGERSPILALELREQMLLAGDRPQVVQRRLGDARHAGDERRPAVGLDADRCAVRAVDVDLRVDARLLATLVDDRRRARRCGTGSIADRGVVDLDVGWFRFAQ